MKAAWRSLCRCLLAGALFVFSESLLPAQAELPVITSVIPKGKVVEVVATVPKGITRVVLESRARLESGAWAPLAVRTTDGSGGTVVFQVACEKTTELLRVRADTTTPLPLSFYGSGSAFWGGASDMGMVTDNTGGGVSPEFRSGDSREVVESDIWKVSGDRVYFFNQYRGLQVIDISNPDAAALKGSFPIASAGEQMYLLDEDNVVLLAREGCSSYLDSSQVLVVGVTNDIPSVIHRLAVPGYVQESRMVGSALYVASQSYRQVLNETNSTWEWGMTVSSYDLADPGHPVVRDTLWFPGYGNVVYATDTLLFVATQDPSNWWQSLVRIFDITSPDGKMSLYGSLQTAGQVNDKFKLNYVDGILTTIAEDWRRLNNSPLVTVLETWRVPDPRSAGPLGITKLGRLELGKGERLHATRFDGARVYIVTFFQVDPLWIVDLSDPASPRISAELEVPGWSTYIEPLGTQLVSVGVETNRVAVSLFDVADPAKPALLSRVALGQSYSWSEANSDEKAFSVLKSAGMILVPYSGDTTNGWASQVQIIDLNATTLVARGTINHAFQPRRATFTHDRVLSLSGQELLVVNASDRDKPVVSRSVTLSWPVDQLLVHGAYLLQVSSTAAWMGESQPALHVSLAESPNELLAQLQLGNTPVTGMTLSGSKLYLAQNTDSAPADPNGSPRPTFTLTVVDVGNLPELRVLGATEAAVSSTWINSWKPFWVRPDVLVWTGGDGGWYWWGRGFSDMGWFAPWPWRNSGAGHFLAFELADGATPRLVSELNLRTNEWYGFSGVIQVGTMLYLSHSTTEPVITEKTTNYVQRTYLDVVDFADPATPTVRKPVNIPGRLEGVSHSGELLYTRGTHWAVNQTDWREYLDASAYNGVGANLVASMPLSENWPHPVLVAGTNVLVGNAQYESGTRPSSHSLQSWFVADIGKFMQAGVTALGSPASSLWHKDGLLAAQDSNSQVLLFSLKEGSLMPLSKQSSAGCYWFDLNNADGDLSRGLWIPLGSYGVLRVPVVP